MLKFDTSCKFLLFMYRPIKYAIIKNAYGESYKTSKHRKKDSSPLEMEFV